MFLACTQYVECTGTKVPGTVPGTDRDASTKIYDTCTPVLVINLGEVRILYYCVEWKYLEIDRSNCSNKFFRK
jgi:hypothetical protein